jgi:protocatechuate 3,4-dioxygenase beta subunit
MDSHNVFDLGLPADLSMWMRTPLARRKLLRMGAAGIGVLLAGCGRGPGGPPGFASEPTKTSANGACVSLPGETNGPFPADGSNASNQTLNVLTASGIVRSDVRTSLGTGTVAGGVSTRYELTMVNVNANCAPLAGYAMYSWQCDREGRYSMYSSGVTAENYLRGVQVADANGLVVFDSVFPGCYPGRWPHLHFEIYKSLETATAFSNVVLTSQLGLPEAACNDVYANTDGYSASVSTFKGMSFATDNVFSDGATSQLATTSGDRNSGFVVKLTVGVAA